MSFSLSEFHGNKSQSMHSICSKHPLFNIHLKVIPPPMLTHQYDYLHSHPLHDRSGTCQDSCRNSFRTTQLDYIALYGLPMYWYWPWRGPWKPFALPFSLWNFNGEPEIGWEPIFYLLVRSHCSATSLQVDSHQSISHVHLLTSYKMLFACKHFSLQCLQAVGARNAS